MEKLVYQAHLHYLTVIPESRGEAKRIIAEAKAQAHMIVEKAKGEGGRFSAILDEYRHYPVITRDRLYLETMDHVFKQIPNTIVDEKIKGMFPIFMGNQSTGQSQKILPIPAQEELITHKLWKQKVDLSPSIDKQKPSPPPLPPPPTNTPPANTNNEVKPPPKGLLSIKQRL